MPDSHLTPGSSHSEADDVAERIQRHMRDEADLVPMPAVDSASTERIERRARKARSRRTAAVGAAMSISVAAVGFGALQATAPTNELITADQVNESASVLSNTPTTSANAATNSASGEEGTGGAGAADTELVSDGPVMTWTEVRNASSSIGPTIFVHQGEFVSYSTGGELSLSFSSDGTNWVDKPTGLDFAAFFLDSAGDAIVAYGPALEPDDAESSSTDSGLVGTRVSYSLDQGDSWTELILPGEPLSDDVNVTMAAIGNTIVASRSTFSESEIPSSQLYRSVDGAPFEPFAIDVSILEAPGEVTAVGNVIVVNSFATGDQARSGNGLDWTVGSSSNRFRELVQSSADEQLAISYDADAVSGAVGVLERSTDGGETWESPFDLPRNGYFTASSNADGYVVAVDTTEWSPEDFAAEDAAASEFEALGSLTFRKDGLDIVIEPQDDEPIYVIDVATGEEIFRSTLDGTDEGPGVDYDEDTETVTITDLETGEKIVSFTAQEFQEAMEDQMPSFDQAPMSSFFIGFTADGERFGWQSIDDAFGIDNASWVDLKSNGDTILATVFTEFGSTRVFVATGPGE